MSRTLVQAARALAAQAPAHLDLTEQEHLISVQEAADQLLLAARDSAELSELERSLLESSTSSPLWLHLAVKLARSKHLMDILEHETRISVIFAMYKEHLRILPRTAQNPVGEDFLRRKVQQLEWLTRDNSLISWRILAVDDGCPDGSGRIAERITRETGLTERIEVLFLADAIDRREPVTRPLTDTSQSQKGGSILLGMERAVHQSEANHVVLFTDADLSTHLGQTGLLLKPILWGTATVAIGSRRESTSVVVKQGRRNTRGKLFIYLWKQLLPTLQTVVDTQCGFKAFRADTVPEIVMESLEKGFAFDIELLLRSELATPGAVGLVPIAWIDSEAASTTTDLEPYLPMLRSIVSFYRHYLSADPRSETFASLIDSLDESGWNRLIDHLPAGIANGNPVTFGMESTITATDLADRIRN